MEKSKRPWRAYTAEELAFLEANYKGITRKELTDMFNARFPERAPEAIINACKRRGWNNGLDGHFQKGHESHTKGKKMPQEIKDKIRKSGGFYKKGHRPENALPVGSLVKKSVGYWARKVAEPNVWRFEHLLVYEENFGPIPENCIVHFCDGNRDNLSPDNLLLETKAQSLIKNNMNLYGYDKESEKTACLIADLVSKTYKKERRLE